ncbi:MAG: 5'/3'-nucleotidase SurE [Melioribacteraceae bacterium]|nr:5'/3'-nucleotidase SurE [Ignavibacteriota bacterium]MBZ0182265.1 5'/3'-nucleotidase SurE [Melioribacteraceae bacterium]
MKILISNDDGINSLGIYALAKSLKEIGDVTVVAPITEQSAVGHAITMKAPLRVVEHYINGEFFGYAVEGTPADCVKMGIRNILKSPPDIVVSGINHGSNTAINIIYSGTVSAAREAAIMDVPAVAFSLTSHISRDFSFAAKIAQDIVKEVVKNNLPLGTCLNVNIPAVPENEINGVLLTKQSKSKWDDIYEERTDPYGKSYYWLTGSLVEVDDNLETDQFAIKNNYVAVTPIHFDLTDYKTYEEMKKWNIERKFVE